MPFRFSMPVSTVRLKRRLCAKIMIIARRTATFDVKTAWNALLSSRNPKDILSNSRLLQARAEINDEVERHTHAAPKFSKNGKIAVLRINSAAQVHPVIATRWVSSNPFSAQLLASDVFLGWFSFLQGIGNRYGC